MTRLLLLKAHIPEHQRHLSDGRSVTVAAHEDNRPQGASTIIPPHWIDGKHTHDSREYLRPVPAHSPFFKTKRKWVRVHTFKNDGPFPNWKAGEASLTHPSGYVSSHPSLDAAFEHAEKTIYATPDAKGE